MTAAERIEEARGRAGLHAAPGDMVEVELPEALGKALWDRQEALLEKGAGHKYIRRVPTGKAKPKYRYFYSVSGGKGVGHHSEFKVGASFRLDQDGQEGHFHVLEVRPDMSLRVRHDETGHETTVSPGGLDTMLRHQHGQAMKQHGARLARDVRAAIKHGTEKQVRRLEDEAKRYHWTRDAASIGEGGRAAAAADRWAQEYEKKLDAAEEKAKAEETERRKAGVVLYEQVSPWRAFQTKYEGASVGDVALFKNDKTPRVVVARHAQYIREDGLSFGIDDDSGWKITYTVRPLTEPERAEWDRYAAATKAHASTAKAAKEVVWGSHKITGAERPEKAEIPSGCRDIIIRGGGAHSPPNMIRVEPGEKHAWLMRYVGASSGAGNSGSYVATRVPFTGKVKEVVEWIDAGHKQPERPTFKVSEADKRKGPAEAKRKQAEQWERGRAAAVAALRAKGSTSPGPSAPPKPSAAALLEDTSATTDSLAQALSRENNRGLGARALVGPTDEVVLIGNTYEHKDDIRQAGGRWNSASRQWTMPDPHAAAVAMGFDLSDKAKAAQLEQRVARNRGKAERREQRIARNKAAREAQEKARASSPATPAPAPVRRGLTREAQEKARASSPATPAPAPVRRGLRGEKAGRRVYVQGNTYEHKDALRGMGFKWDPSERAWWTGTANWKQNQDEVEALGKSDVAALLGEAREALEKGRALCTELPEWLGASLYARQEGELLKGAGHKYVRRVPTGKARPRYRYFYDVTGGRGLGHHDEFVEGAAFRLTHEGRAGHFHVLSADGDALRIRHDETGHEQTVTKIALHRMLHREHAKIRDQHEGRTTRNFYAAQQHGSARQIARLKEEADRYFWTRRVVALQVKSKKGHDEYLASVKAEARAEEERAAEKKAKAAEKKAKAAEKKAKDERQAIEARRIAEAGGGPQFEEFSSQAVFPLESDYGGESGSVVMVGADKDDPRVIVDHATSMVPTIGYNGPDYSRLRSMKTGYILRTMTEAEKAKLARYQKAAAAHESNVNPRRLARQVPGAEPEIESGRSPLPSGCREVRFPGDPDRPDASSSIAVEPDGEHAWFIYRPEPWHDRGSFYIRVPYTTQVKKAVKWAEKNPNKKPPRPPVFKNGADVMAARDVWDARPKPPGPTPPLAKGTSSVAINAARDALARCEALSKGRVFLDEDIAQRAHKRVVKQYGLTEGDRYWRLKSAIYRQMGGSFAGDGLKKGDAPVAHIRRAVFDRRGYVGATRRLSVGELREWLANPDNKGRRITAGTPTAR